MQPQAAVQLQVPARERQEAARHLGTAPSPRPATAAGHPYPIGHAQATRAEMYVELSTDASCGWWSNRICPALLCRYECRSETVKNPADEPNTNLEIVHVGSMTRGIACAIRSSTLLVRLIRGCLRHRQWLRHRARCLNIDIIDRATYRCVSRLRRHAELRSGIDVAVANASS